MYFSIVRCITHLQFMRETSPTLIQLDDLSWHPPSKKDANKLVKPVHCDLQKLELIAVKGFFCVFFSMFERQVLISTALHTDGCCCVVDYGIAVTHQADPKSFLSSCVRCAFLFFFLT